MANEDMSQYLGVFLDEAGEQLELLEQSILVLEHDATPELLQEIFRAAHTLKGSSRAMGFLTMGDLTHAMEDVFDRLRKNEIQVTPAIVDALFDGLDELKQMVGEVASGGEPHTDPGATTARLRQALADPDSSGVPAAGPAAAGPAAAGPAAADPVTTSGDGAGGVPADGSAFRHGALPETALVALDEARKTGLEVYQVVVRIAGDCVMKSVRAIMVLQSVETIGAVLGTTPSDDDIENEEFGNQFGFVLTTASTPDAIRDLCTRTAEIDAVDVAVWAPDAEPTAAAPASDPGTAVVASGPAPVAGGPPAPSTTVGSGPPAAVRAAAAQQSQTVRVDVVRLDKLLNLVGELVIDQTRIAQLSAQLDDRFTAEPLVENLDEAASHFGRITAELQEEIMKARMLPIDHVFNRFPRMIRDLAQKLGKDIDFDVSGRETELDRSVIEVIGDPLIHLLRNCLDHGVEHPEERVRIGKPAQGTVWLRARHEENHIVIEVEDDGQGIDPEKMRGAAVKKGYLSAEAAARMNDKDAVNLIFASGFSTAEVVSDVSGRGVGMDIVRNNLTRFGAIIDIDSRVGLGTKFTIKLPLTLAIIRGLLVRVGTGVYVVPLVSVVETLRIGEAQLHMVNQREMIVQRGATLPLVRLQQLFAGGLRSDATPPAESDQTAQQHYIVVVGVAERRVGLVVDALLGEQEIVIKSLGKFIGDVRGISGATLLGDGRIALIADVNGLLAIATSERVAANVT